MRAVTEPMVDNSGSSLQTMVAVMEEANGGSFFNRDQFSSLIEYNSSRSYWR